MRESRGEARPARDSSFPQYTTKPTAKSTAKPKGSPRGAQGEPKGSPRGVQGESKGKLTGEDVLQILSRRD